MFVLVALVDRVLPVFAVQIIVITSKYMSGLGLQSQYNVMMSDNIIIVCKPELQKRISYYSVENSPINLFHFHSLFTDMIVATQQYSSVCQY